MKSSEINPAETTQVINPQNLDADSKESIPENIFSIQSVIKGL